MVHSFDSAAEQTSAELSGIPAPVKTTRVATPLTRAPPPQQFSLKKTQRPVQQQPAQKTHLLPVLTTKSALM